MYSCNSYDEKEIAKYAFEAGQADLEQWKAEWQEQVQKANDESWERTKLTGKVKELEAQIENLVYLHEEDVNTIKLLNEQIEKMKCCGNCKKLKGRFDRNTNINILYCSDSDMKQIEVGFQMCCCKWEIEEK